MLRPGGGKTVAALTAIVDLLRDKVIRHAIVIAPKRVACVVWPDEIEEWAHTKKLNYSILNGSPRDRERLLHAWGLHDIVLIGLDLVPWLFEQLNGLPANHMAWDLLVIDEASRLRAPGGVRAKVLAKHAHRFKMIWGLSGTLRPSGPLDLFMPSRIVTRGKLWGRSYAKWRREHFYPTDYMQYDWKPLPGAEEKLNAELAPLTVTVAEGEMPMVTPTIVFDRVELPDHARHQYEDMRAKLMAKVKDKSVLAVSAAVATGKLAQMANGFVYDGTGVTNELHDAKRAWLRDLIEEATDPTLIIYEYHADWVMLQHEVALATKAGVSLPRLGRDRQAGRRRTLRTGTPASSSSWACTRPAAATGSTCSTAAPTWPGSRPAGRRSTGSRPLPGSRGRVRRGRWWCACALPTTPSTGSRSTACTTR